MPEMDYPQSPTEWQAAIEAGIEVPIEEGSEALADGTFPYAKLADWVRVTYDKRIGPDFVAAVLRNIRGLVAWAYGDKSEPYWPGSEG